MEGIVVYYAGEIEDAKNPGVVLTKFYSEVFSVPFSPALIGQFNKLIKLYGRKFVFRALVEIAGANEIDHKNIYGLINYICKKYLEPKNINKGVDLTPFVEEYNYKISRAKDLTLQPRSPFDE